MNLEATILFGGLTFWLFDFSKLAIWHIEDLIHSGAVPQP